MKIKKKCFFCGGTLRPLYDGNKPGEPIGWWQCSKESCQFNDYGFGESGIRDSYYRKIEKLMADNAELKAKIAKDEK